ncbi:hypothetical protein [Candidatus Mycoplasma haematominutum]|uniref:Lipoprotein n=1 Tax=Candidatus Mycoplasma haematominutum 'Birmingham 1' TaxID=1116213 RepID=G8C3P5_9MOLU|nr:hypothetical protein [Candidatus Mycoplasma haematominutum]CCE66943.1 hypothetical protein MHM_04250 [Candidatus Mycoplasma haematominutum 'Birmingham 1']
MFLTLRSLFGCVGVVSGACATTIPIAMYAVGDNTGGMIQASASGGGTQVSQLQLTKCSGINSGGENVISFGSNTKGPLCWKLKEPSESQTGEIETVNTSLTELFKKEWSKTESKFSGDTSWRSMCVVGGSGPQWTLSTSGGDSESAGTVKYIGTCNTSTTPSAAVSFLEIDSSTEQGKNLTLKLCYRNCFTTSSTGDNQISTFQNKNDSNWRELSFVSLSST